MPRDQVIEPGVNAAECIHHWLLEAPKNGYIEARCRRCRENKLFAATAASRWNRPADTVPAHHVTSGTPG